MTQSNDIIKVALVDDHRLFRQGLGLILSDAEGITLSFEAGHGKEMLTKLPDHPTDVILLDLEMPEMDGEAALKALRQDYPDVKVLILSMHREDHVILHLLEMGADGYVLKDSDPEALEHAIRHVHATGLYLDQHNSGLLLQRARKTTKPRSYAELPVNEREHQVLQLIGQGLTTSEIGEKLFLSPRTIDGYRKELLEKTGVKNTAALVAWAFRNDLLE